ncbi:MAG TPA: glutathione S-transferase family protein [Stellaceae bacterium]|nr:glutathione S-transferase family protein [Stellaceae bacterium]
MIVYGSSLSPFVRKTLTFINEKGLAVEHKPITPPSTLPEFRACSPLGKVPGFADGDYRLSDSSAICHYLERKYPTPALFPESAEEIGRMIWFEEFTDTVLIAAAGKVFFQLNVRPKVLNEEPDMAVVDQALTKELPPLFDYLERQIAGPFLIGNRLTLADIAVHCPFVNLKLAGRPLEAERWPKLGGYLAGLLARPTFKVRDPKEATQ